MKFAVNWDRTQQDDGQDGEDHHERDPYPAGVLEPDLFDLTCYDLMLRRAQDPKYRKRDNDRRYELDKRGAEVRQAALYAEGKAALALREVVIGGRHES